MMSRVDRYGLCFFSFLVFLYGEYCYMPFVRGKEFPWRGLGVWVEEVDREVVVVVMESSHGN